MVVKNFDFVLNVAVYVVAVAGAMIVWDAALPSDQELNVQLAPL